MKTVSQHIRKRVEACLPQRPDLAELRKTQWSKDFELLMRNRLLIGAFRYGLLEDSAQAGYDKIGSLKSRLQMYVETGNTEFLVDVANLALLEFEFPNHPKSHFAAVDDGDHCF